MVVFPFLIDSLLKTFQFCTLTKDNKLYLATDTNQQIIIDIRTILSTI